MALTIPSLGKALEDVTAALKKNDNELKKVKDIQSYTETLIHRLHAKKPATGVEDFAEEAASPVVRDITPETIKSTEYAVEAKSDNNNAAAIVLSSLGILEDAKPYIISVNFKTETQPTPNVATVECVNVTATTVVATSDTPVVNGKCSAKLTFTYRLQQPTNEVKLLLYAGKKGATAGIAGTYTHLKIEAIETLTKEQQQEKAQSLLDACVTERKPYYNVIRNKNGITVPEPQQAVEAVNKAYIDTRLVPLESKMPLNPVRAYDMADEWCHEKLLYKISTPIINKKEAMIDGGFIVYRQNQPETRYHVHVESSSTGNARPALILYRQDWAPRTYIIWEYCNGVQDFFVSIPQQNYNFGIGIWMHGDGSYQVQPDDSVTVHKFTVTEITEKRLIDSSGTGNHAIITIDAVKVNDNTVGTALLLMKGSLTSNFSSFIGVGKQWSHSRWIRIDGNHQKAGEGTRLWQCGMFDYAIMDIDASGIATQTVNILCYKDSPNLHFFNIQKTQLLDDQWHNLIVMTDLQKTYCWRAVYIDGKKIDERKVTADFSNFPDNHMMTDMLNVKGYLGGQLFFDRLLTEPEIQWIAHNPYYPAKRYSLAEYKADQK